MKKFRKLSQKEQNSWIDFVMQGPSQLQMLILINKLVNQHKLGISSKPVNMMEGMEFLDGILEDYEAVRDRRKTKAEEAAIDSELAAVAAMITEHKED